jgi:cyclic pyranopterin phosphate synthase
VDDVTRLTHLDENGAARMVDVAGKDVTHRRAVASALVTMRPETLAMIVEGRAPKGDVFALTHVSIDLAPEGSSVRVTAVAETDDKTGVEMEALTAASVAALTIYDMCKAVDRGMVVTDVMLLEKEGGKSGHYLREDPR